MTPERPTAPATTTDPSKIDEQRVAVQVLSIPALMRFAKPGPSTEASFEVAEAASPGSPVEWARGVYRNRRR